VTVEHFGLFRPEGTERAVAPVAAAGFGVITAPAPPVAGKPSRGSGVATAASEANHVWLYVSYALAVPVLLLVAITVALIWLRRRRLHVHLLELKGAL